MSERKGLHGYYALFMGIVKALAIAAACVFIVLLVWYWTIVIYRIMEYYSG